MINDGCKVKRDAVRCGAGGAFARRIRVAGYMSGVGDRYYILVQE